MKKLIIISLSILMLLTSRGQAMATELASAGSSASLVSVQNKYIIIDDRVQILHDFLESYNSPLAPYAQNFITSADKYNLDWRLVASIAGLESTFGKHIPYNSYNGWGWGIYGDNVLRFNSWPEAIDTISEGLRVKYLKNKTESDPYFIGPSYAASPTWAPRVLYFMNKIDAYKQKNTKPTLSLAL